ncbi:polysaccharide deacetylase family protein [Sulfobacillus thermosulfidooxidans]|uniref:polysaccharide deacetylase family protein n=1 Tax=Sulfobacillus thermosulfidooxidans TaxID=28034 RepID=UPI0006B69FA6|nr:polysaccharide deacetylase family protein [Sulfobacillus thermosulfidooxidans]
MTLYGLIRFDIEDFVTEESDEALAFVLDVMDEYQMPASYGIVGKKAQSLFAHHQTKTLERLAQKHALGFHSTSHSEHPTIAEEMAELDYADGVARFIAREQVGINMVKDLIKSPLYFTQPGGNWVPQAVDALSQLNMPIFFSDSWNSYLDTASQPMWIEDIVHWSLPVLNPKPFALKLPDNLDEAIHLIEQAPQNFAPQDAFMIMIHPTELVTTKFWDAVNFELGATNATLRKAPLRCVQDRHEAYEGFRQYIRHIRHIASVEWIDVASLSGRIQPLTSPALFDSQTLLTMITRYGLGPAILHGQSYSAADMVVALALLMTGATPGQRLPRVKAPLQWGSQRLFNGQAMESLGEELLRHSAHEIVGQVLKTGRLPALVRTARDLPIEEWAASAIYHFGTPWGAASLPLTFLDYVKEPRDLHWDWPIFPPDFHPYPLWQETRRLAWSLKWAQYQS